MFLARGLPRQTLIRAAAAFAGVLVAGFLPFLIADAGALWDDTIGYGAGTYRILGYGLSALLLNAGVIDDRYGAYPFGLLALLVWLPVTAWLVWLVRRSRPRLGGGRRLRDLDLHAALHRPRLPDVVPRSGR